MKVIHLDTGRDLRGGQRQLLLLARGLRKRGHEQTIVCPQGSALQAHAGREGFLILALPFQGPRTARAIFQIRSLLRSQHFQVLHAHDGRGQTLGWMASSGTSVRRIASRRVAFLPRRRGLHRFEQRLTCHGIIAVSRFVRELLLECGIPAAKIEVIHDGIDFPGPPPDIRDKALLRERWQLGERDFVIGHAGAFTPEKGQEVAVRAFHLVTKTLPQGRLLLAGDGPLLRPIEKQLRSAPGGIRLLGYLDDLTPFLYCLDLFIMPSRSEGLGSTALLAMAHGTPVVASRVGGLPEIIEDERTGWLVEPGSPAALAQAIIAAASDGTRLQQMGQNARQKARQFTDDIMTEHTASFYSRVLEGLPASR